MLSRSWACQKCRQGNIFVSSNKRLVAWYSDQQTITPAPERKKGVASLPTNLHLLTQPSSHKPPEFRRSQLHRQYTSLIKSTPLIVLFQHNNLTASEWSGIRRELDIALEKTDKEQALLGNDIRLAGHIKLQVIKTGVFSAALRVVEYFVPTQSLSLHSEAPADEISTPERNRLNSSGSSIAGNSLSRAAYDAVYDRRNEHPLVSFLSGPVAILTFPTMSTEHLKSAISILSPSKPDFTAPTRRNSPGYYELPVQTGLPKLMLLGARVNSNVVDVENTRWVGKISGGLSGLRAQLVSTLQSAGITVSTSLSSISRNLALTLEGRESMLREDGDTNKKL